MPGNALVPYAPEPRIDIELELLAGRINEAHAAYLQAEADQLRHAIQAGNLLVAVKSKVGHGQFQLWIQQNCQCSYATALDYKVVAEWCAANPERAQFLKSIRQVLANRRQDKLRTVRLQMISAEWIEYWKLLDDLAAKGISGHGGQPNST